MILTSEETEELYSTSYIVNLTTKVFLSLYSNKYSTIASRATPIGSADQLITLALIQE
jgi:hypothetical protein